MTVLWHGQQMVGKTQEEIEEVLENRRQLREYVEFYRFWAWEYTKRNPGFREIVTRWNEAEEYFCGLGIPNFSMTARGLTDPDSIVAFEPYIDRAFTDGEFQLFGTALIEGMKARLNYGFEVTGPETQKVYSSNQILELLQSEGVLIRPQSPRERSEVARLVRQREIQNGIKVLYDESFPIFGYDALVAIDFDRPISEIQSQIVNVKKEFEIYREIENGGNDFPIDFETVEIEKIGIQKNPDIKFKIGTDNPRAIGIWLWDRIYDSGEPKKRGTISETIRELRAKFNFDNLGYADSDSRVFSNILTKTKDCIERAEVLALH